VNLWEENGFDGLAESWAHETGHAAMQDPKLAQWWARAAEFRSGGVDRILVPAPWTSPIAGLLAAGVTGVVYAHELVRVRPGQATRYLDGVAELAPKVTEAHGWQVAGAWHTAMSDDSECLVLWAIPTWKQWADFERQALRTPHLGRPRGVETLSAERILLVDAPLSPLRTGRQPSREDRTEPYQEA